MFTNFEWTNLLLLKHHLPYFTKSDKNGVHAEHYNGENFRKVLAISYGHQHPRAVYQRDPEIGPARLSLVDPCQIMVLQGSFKVPIDIFFYTYL